MAAERADEFQAAACTRSWSSTTRPRTSSAYRAALESLGREIVTATSGNEATQLLGHQQFSLLLIDVRMPGLDGFATVELLRHQLHKLTPVIFITGDTDDATMRRAYEFGAVDYLVKPVSPEILRGKVRNLLVLYDQGIELEKRAALLMEQHQRILEADALLQRKDTNIGILAHDLRNPLAAITTSADLLARYPAGSDKAHRIDRADQSQRAPHGGHDSRHPRLHARPARWRDSAEAPARPISRPSPNRWSMKSAPAIRSRASKSRRRAS